MRRIATVVMVVAASACISTDTTPCGDGRCLAGAVCALVDVGATADHPAEQLGFCVRDDQLTGCAGMPDRMACTVETMPGTCHGGACFPDECGNRLQDSVELCDDGNTASMDGCSSDCRSDEACRNGIVDVVTGEACDDHNDLSHDGCSASCDVETARWEIQGYLPPGARADYGFVFDPVRHRGLMFGGATGLSGGGPVGDTHEWDGGRWLPATTGIGPLPRSQHGMAYDHERRVVVLFGGFNGETFADTWQWDGVQWEQQTATTSPPARRNLAITYDARRKRVVLFGGAMPTGAELGDTWSWDGTTWEAIGGTTQPPAREGAAMAFDPVRGVVVLFGGERGGAQLSDIWELGAAGWVQRMPSAPVPPPRSGHAMAFDPLSLRIVVAGGLLGVTPDASVWQWDGDGWTRSLEMTLPNAVTAFELVSDPIRGRLLLWEPIAVDPAIFPGASLYEWGGVTWEPRDERGSVFIGFLPFEGSGHAAAVDRSSRRVIVFGGTRQATSSPSNETWGWNGAWQPMQSAALPPPRYGAAMVATETDYLMFGGRDDLGAFKDMGRWRLNPVTTVAAGWEPVSGTLPGGRSGHSMVFDPIANLTVMFGGEQLNGTKLDDTWLFDGLVWTQLSAPGPVARTRAAMAYHPIRGTIVMFGGLGTAGGLADTWEWDRGTRQWRSIVPEDLAPAPRFSTAMAWDATRKRLVVVGGSVGPANLNLIANDVWEAGWDGDAMTWRQLVAAGPFPSRTEHVLVGGIEGNGVLALGGRGTSTFYPLLGDVWLLQWTGATSYETCTDLDTDGDLRVGCDDLDCWSVCSPQCPPGATSCGPPTCNDGILNDLYESCFLCPLELQGPCASRCGDFKCDSSTETAGTCPGDCS